VYLCTVRISGGNPQRIWLILARHFGGGSTPMAFFEDLAKGEILSGNVLTGLAIGAATVILAPLAAPLLRPR
jgi:hypothetical protein